MLSLEGNTHIELNLEGCKLYEAFTLDRETLGVGVFLRGEQFRRNSSLEREYTLGYTLGYTLEGAYSVREHTRRTPFWSGTLKEEPTLVEETYLRRSLLWKGAH